MRIVKLPNPPKKNQFTTSAASSSSPFNHFTLIVIISLMLCSNYITYYFGNSLHGNTWFGAKQAPLYLLNKASAVVKDVSKFEAKVRDVSNRLKIAPEWLMAVMHAESRFNASILNHKGSGATGLIQFMPATAKDFGITVEELKKLDAVNQLDYVYRYLNSKRRQYKAYESLTDLYLAILYPKAMTGSSCYTLYAKGSKAYAQNSGLDEDKDGRVTVQDIDSFLQRLYPTAYAINQDQGNVFSDESTYNTVKARIFGIR